jgi:16S rRNA (adenine1518-N6/adenine1519-N6)-dimethyltransferase
VLGAPSSSAAPRIALERAAWADAGIAFQVGPGAFRPRPKVVSSVIMLQLHPPVVDLDALEGGLRLASHALNHSRKMLANALRPLCDADRIIAAGLDPQARPATIDLAGWIRLAALGV